MVLDGYWEIREKSVEISVGVPEPYKKLFLDEKLCLMAVLNGLSLWLPGLTLDTSTKQRFCGRV